jgi:hypothetical protein
VACLITIVMVLALTIYCEMVSPRSDTVWRL